MRKASGALYIATMVGAESLYVGTVERVRTSRTTAANPGIPWQVGFKHWSSTRSLQTLSTRVMYAGTFGGSRRKTVDGGNTWPVVFTGNRGIFGIAIDPDDSDVVYFGTVGAGAFKSSNAGASWTPMSALTPR